MRLIAIITVALFALVAGTMAQDYSQLFAGFGPYIRAASPMRDPRANTGPVLFPMGPPESGGETSGVIVGASGFGFVPPNSGFFYYF
ncbi:uncharacterized protein LOC122850000 [Aphidius gifuensis]|uniref:uncharacterized protein LOC122850000 n=1 Tax=Aphidius gifuensis TaxID=684658 RepID=UPI001CDD8289|nr:uncharacterized protein LOC122850000 [Aphidius gifuensis]